MRPDTLSHICLATHGILISLQILKDPCKIFNPLAKLNWCKRLVHESLLILLSFALTILLQSELFYTMYILCTGKMKVYNCIQYHLNAFCSWDRSFHLSVALTLPTRHTWYGLHNVLYSGWLFPGRAWLLHDCSCMLTFACKHQTCCINDIQRNMYDCPTFCGMLWF